MLRRGRIADATGYTVDIENQNQPQSRRNHWDAPLRFLTHWCACRSGKAINMLKLFPLLPRCCRYRVFLAFELHPLTCALRDVHTGKDKALLWVP